MLTYSNQIILFFLIIILIKLSKINKMMNERDAEWSEQTSNSRF